MNALISTIANRIPGANVNALVDVLPRLGLSAQLLDQAKDVVLPRIFAVAGTAFSVTGLAALLPSLGVLSLNALGFTSAGVAAGSIAAFLQALLYGAFTGGVFALLMSFGATAMIASPVVLVFGVLSLGAGAVSWLLPWAIF